MDPETDPVGSGPVAQGIRARGYEPRCRGFESLLARNQSFPDEIFPLSILGFCILYREESACNFGSYAEDKISLEEIRASFSFLVRSIFDHYKELGVNSKYLVRYS